MKKQPEARRHHFIPKFIIRNFSSNELGFIRYFNKKTNKFSNEPIEETFKYNDLYRDEINIPDDPVKIEKDFGKYEGEIAQLLKNKFLKGDDITLTIAENESLMLFLALMNFRSKHVLPTFSGKASQNTKEMYSHYQKDGDLLSLWKRNLGQLVNCRSIDDVMKNDKIDAPFKGFMLRDTFGPTGQYFIIAERRGGEDFFLSDLYPVVLFAVADDGLQIPMMSFYPISPNRIVITCGYGVENARQEVRQFEKNFFTIPQSLPNKGGYKFHVRKIYEPDVRFINDMFYEHTKEGIVLFDQDRFFVNDRNK